jgi:hypothetical protein
MAVKVKMKLADLTQAYENIEINENGDFISVRPLNLKDVIDLLMSEADNFLSLYATAIEGKLEALDSDGQPKVAHLMPFLLSAPSFVAKVIAVASDEPESAATVEKLLPSPVQLIALRTIIKKSVPNPKKAQELLSEVTALAQRLQKRQETLQAERQLEMLSSTI